MKESWEQVLSSLLQGLVGEGGRLVKSKALALFRRVISAARLGMILAYSVMILCFICALAAFASVLFYGVRQKMIELGVPTSMMFGTVWPRPLWLALGTFVSTALLLWVTTSQLVWERALGLKKYSEDDSQPTQVNITLGSNIDEAQIIEIVDRVVEKRLHPSRGKKKSA